MRRTAICVLVFLASLVSAHAQTPRYDHVHLAAADPAKAVEWYVKNLGARPGDAPDRVLVGRTIFPCLKRDGARTSAGGAVDHIGFSFADLDGKVKELEAAGAKVL